MLQEIRAKEKNQNKEGPPTESIRIEQLMQGRLSTPTSNDIIKRNEICGALLTTPLRNINHRVREAEKFGKGPASNTLMDIILEYMFGWYLAQQTFVSREEGEFGNQAAKLWIHFKCAVGIELSWTE